MTSMKPLTFKINAIYFRLGCLSIFHLSYCISLIELEVIILFGNVKLLEGINDQRNIFRNY